MSRKIFHHSVNITGIYSAWFTKKWTKKKLDWTHKFSTWSLACSARMAKQGNDEPIKCKSCGLPIITNNHLFQCLKWPQFLCIQSIMDDVRDTLNPKLYHLLKHHLTAYIQGKDLLSITTMALTHKCKVSRPSLLHSCLKRSNLDTNPYVDSVPHRPSRLIHNPYIL